MKKIKTLSVLLSALTAFSGLSITTASAVETNTNELKIIDYPEDILERDIDEVIYDLTIQLPNGSKIVTNEGYFDAMRNSDYRDTLGVAGMATLKDNGSSGFQMLAVMCVADTLTFEVGYWDEKNDIWDFCELELEYPDDCELPDIFCKDGISYEKNADNTLTVKSMVRSDSIPYGPLEIPETVNGMTVTAIADNAFICPVHMSDVTIPKTVTSIGEKAFGYCSGNHIHEYDYQMPASPMGMKFVEADDDEEFSFNTSYYGEQEDFQHIKETYFANCDSVTFDSKYMEIYGTAKKSQILPLIEVEYLYVYFESGETKLDDFLVMVMDEADDETLIPITIRTTATGEVTASKIRKALKKRYFDEDTEFYYDWFDHIYVEATKAQINALKDDEYVMMVNIGDSELIMPQLYYEIYNANEEDTFNITITSGTAENTEHDLKLAHEAYFENCEGGYVMIDGEPYYVIYGATRQQILDTVEVDYMYIGLFDEPLVSKYKGLTIHGEAGSYAEEYAKANEFAFEQTKSDYILGDVNLDGTITIVDATLIMKSNVGMEAFTEQQTKLADFNKDGFVNVVDATEIQKKLAGF